jgi:hypothetical protein
VILAVIAGLLRAILDMADFGQMTWADRWAWFRAWRHWRFTIFHLPLDMWHVVAILHALALLHAGKQMENIWLSLLIYYCSKTVFYECLLRADPIAGLRHFMHAFRTPWRFDP